ncbi:MAG TPA: hypothetical protein VIH42_02870 [Thermoguttaceae bacterium]
MHTDSCMYCTLQQDVNGRLTEGDGSIVTDALARIPGKTATVLTDCPVEFDHPEDFHAHLLHAMRHGGTLIVEQHLDDGFLGQVIYGIEFYRAMMKILSPHELKKYRNSGVIYGNFEDFLAPASQGVEGKPS